MKRELGIFGHPVWCSSDVGKVSVLNSESIRLIEPVLVQHSPGLTFERFKVESK